MGKGWCLMIEKELLRKRLMKLNKKCVYTMQSILRFGKHKTEEISEIIINDPKYIEWCLNEKIFELDKTSYKYFEVSLENYLKLEDEERYYDIGDLHF